MRFWLLVISAAMVTGHAVIAAADGRSDLNDCYAASKRGDDDTAIALCSRALRSGDLSNEDIAAALNNRGAAYNDKGEHVRAIQDFDQAIRLRPDYSLAYNNRGLAYSLRGRYDRAIQDYDQAIRLNPDDALAFDNRGDAYAYKGAYAQAVGDYDQAIRMKPEWTASLSFPRGRALFNLARFKEAATALETYVRARPQDAYGVLWRTIADRRAGKSADGDLYAEAKALDLAKWPGPIIRLYLGSISGDAVLTATADPDPETAKGEQCEAAFYVGELDLFFGRAGAAKAGLQHAVEICPKDFMEAGGAAAELHRM